MSRFFPEPDIEVVKLDEDAREQWRHRTRTWTSDEPVGAVVDGQGRLVVASTTQDRIGETHHGEDDVLVSIYQPLRVLDADGGPSPREEAPIPRHVLAEFDHAPVWKLPDRAGVIAPGEDVEANRMLFVIDVDDAPHLVLPVFVQDAWLEGPLRHRVGGYSRALAFERLPRSVRAWSEQTFQVFSSEGQGGEQRYAPSCVASLGAPFAMADELLDHDSPDPEQMWLESRRLLVSPLIPVTEGASCDRAAFVIPTDRKPPTILAQSGDVPIDEVEGAFRAAAKSSIVRDFSKEHREFAKEQRVPYAGPRSFSRATRWGSTEQGLVEFGFWPPVDEWGYSFLVTERPSPEVLFAGTDSIAAVLDLEGDGRFELLVYSDWWGPGLLVHNGKRWRVESALLTHPQDPC